MRFFSLIFSAILLWASPSYALVRGGLTIGVIIPVADTICTITTGNCTGIGAGSSLFTAATCNGDGTTDDAASFRSFNSYLVGTYRVSNPSTRVRLSIPSGAVCQFITGGAGGGAGNAWGKNAGLLDTVGYGATINDNLGTGAGFLLGCGGCGVQFNGTNSTVRLATVNAGDSSITLLDTSKCSLFNNGDTILITGIDSQGFGDPPNPDRFEWPIISSVASCAGSGVITLTAPVLRTYKSTWPLYNAGVPGLNSDQGGPATAYQLAAGWGSTVQAIYGLTIDQRANQTNANGRDISLYDISCPSATSFCVIPSQNDYFRITNMNTPSARTEVDKIVAHVVYTNVTLRQLNIQSAEITDFQCNQCTIGPLGVSGTTRSMTFTNSNLADVQLGAGCCGASGSFTAVNTVISSLETQGGMLANVDKRGTWSGGTLTVPANMHVNSYSNSPTTPGLIRLTVPTTAGWTTGIMGDGCGGTFAVTVIDATDVDLQGSTYSAGVCAGTGAFGSLPFGNNGTFFVPGANIYLVTGSHGFPTSQFLQVADLAVGANNATVISFNQNGSPYAGGLPVMPAGAVTAFSHPAPSFSCSGCTGAINVTDVNGLPTGPFGSQATRVVTAANSGNATPMPVFGPLSELDMTVTAACSGASTVGPESVYFTGILGSTSFSSWATAADATQPSATPRVMTQTTTSGAQSGDSLVAAGVGTLILAGQTIPQYSSVGNCGGASTTFTVKTNQGVVYP